MPACGILAKKKFAEATRIRRLVYEAGLTFTRIDREYGLPRGSAADTLRHPNINGERAIAAALDHYPHLLWRTRYRPNGQRRSPQDWSRPPMMAPRRQEARA